jgi:membrane protease YdiL (CAAX protease family)
MATLLVAFGVIGFIELIFSPLDDMDVAYLERMARYQQLPGGWIALTVFVALVVPVIEEFCFRGHIQHALERRFAPWLAILVTGTLFTLVHISPAHSSLLLVPLVLGLGMGLVTVLFQSIWVAVIIHAIWNGIMSAQGVMGGDADAAMEQAGLLPMSLTLLVMGGVGWAMVLRNGRFRVLLDRPRAHPG